MRNLLTLAALSVAALMFAGDVFAQQCGTSCGTNQCALNSRPRTAEPPAVPQAAPASLQTVAAADEWKAPEAEESPFMVAAYRQKELEVQPVGLNLGLVNVGNGNRRGDVDGFLTAQQAQLSQQQQDINRLREEVINARARGEEVSYEDVQRIVTARYQPTPDEAYQLMRSSPQFQRDLQEMLNSQRPEIVRWEIVPVE